MMDQTAMPRRSRLAGPLKWVFILFNAIMLFVVGSSVYDIFVSPAAGPNGFPELAYVPVVIAAFIWFFGAIVLGIGLGLATGRMRPSSNFSSDGIGFDGDFDGPSD